MTQYYVDATDGSDSNTGLSIAQAWKTLSKINGFGFLPGDIISLQKGETWREQFAPTDSGSEENIITYNSYGSGMLQLLTVL